MATAATTRTTKKSASQEPDRSDLFKVSLPQTLTIEELARELYPEAFREQDTFERRHLDMQHLARCFRTTRETPPMTWMTLESHQKQTKALEFALTQLHQQLSDYFYTWTTWPCIDLNGVNLSNSVRPANPAKGFVWFLFSPVITTNTVTQAHEWMKVEQRGRVFPKYWENDGFYAPFTTAIKLPDDETLVRVRVDSQKAVHLVEDPSKPRIYADWCEDYVGPASGLLAWARKCGIVAQRLDMRTADTHHWSIGDAVPVGTRRTR
jgi:hypothetical protein